MLKRSMNLSLLLIILFIIILPTFSSAFPGSSYSLSLRAGSQVYEVKYYNDNLWKSTVNPLSNPSDLFDGEANIIGAKSKLIPQTTGGNDLSEFGIFIQFFFKWFDVPYNSLLKPNGYNDTYITERYPYYYLFWDCEFGYWNFTTKQFKIYSDYPLNPGTQQKIVFILQDPSLFSRMLLDYNDFATVVNNDTVIKAGNYSLPLINGEDLLWELFKYRLVVASPINSYLNQITNSLNCTNASVQDDSITLRRYGENIFDVDIKFNSLGIMDTIQMRNEEGVLFYHIVSSYPRNDVYILFGVFCGIIFGLIGIHIYLRNRRKKEIATNVR
jgi:hypothetical protein